MEVGGSVMDVLFVVIGLALFGITFAIIAALERL
jgi:hypothetical protein